MINNKINIKILFIKGKKKKKKTFNNLEKKNWINLKQQKIIIIIM